MTTREIIKQYLLDNGFDGLCSPGECGCHIDDLAPCENMDIDQCEPAYACPIKPCAFPSEFHGQCLVINRDIAKCPEVETE